jgi:hypothetical protein
MDNATANDHYNDSSSSSSSTIITIIITTTTTTPPPHSPELLDANLTRLGALLLLAFLHPPDPATKYALAIVCATSNRLPLDSFAFKSKSKDEYQVH